MPYRRLPNTDKARLRALAKSIRKFEAEGVTDLPYSETTLQQVRTLLPKFKNALLNLEAARLNQSDKNKEYQESQKKVRLYISHFLQVMNFAILRGELKPTIRAYYGTDVFDNFMPQLQSEDDIIKWGKKIIEGDQQRIMKGGSPFYNPSIALVKVNYERFLDSYRFQQNLIATTERNVNLVSSLRNEVDELMVQLWNEIEASFSHLPDDQKRENAEAFGLVYVLRRKERKRLLEQDLITEEEDLEIEEIQEIQNTEQIELEVAELEQVQLTETPIIEEVKHITEAPKLEKPIKSRKEKDLMKFNVYQSQLNF